MRHNFHVRRTGHSTASTGGHSYTGPGDHEHFAPLSNVGSPVYLPTTDNPTGGSTLHTGSRPRSSYPNHVLARQYRKEHHHDYDEHVGAEPGVNPRSRTSIAEYSHFKQECVIDVVDYDADDVTFRRVSNAGLIELLNAEDEEHLTGESDSATLLPPRMVRWINIAGIDWSVLSAVALKYNLHSLALEDILHERGHNHSKADYYPDHLFLRVLCHSLEIEDDDETRVSTTPTDFCSPNCSSNRLKSDQLSNAPLSDMVNLDLEGGEALSPKIFSEQDSMMINNELDPPKTAPPPQDSKPKGKGKDHSGIKLALGKRWTGLSGFGGAARVRKRLEIEALKKGDRVLVRHQPMFIFLLYDGTVISIHPNLNLEYTCPIEERLHRPDSVLRTSEDASLLVQSLLDLVVDRVLEVVDEYQVKINKLEHDILLHPVTDSVRSLHILSGDLIMHKRTLEPIRTMVYGLRRYDLERCRAVADSMALERQRFCDKELETNYDEVGGHQLSSGETRRVEGFFSYKSKVYLADVSDHMDFALTSLDMFAATSENLINYAFNVASYEMNVVMNRLTLATIIFLPLTLLTGYFGMNFTPFWSVDSHSDRFFWKIAVPVMVALIPIFMYDDIKKGVRYFRRRSDSRLAAAKVGMDQ
ncbi:hypothetical protein M413DRAFT_61489 [Hebeloma cylindrosporum]|uniref:Magnesium transporter n=1 Tax=Hebeloma cylindrosporum TaxID=76867 RepID=A0A0C3CFX5_HEBCY|nr:hypothetical protein M413DRAFT_61489 [Hebeloma cylindrosporum h7]